MDINLMMLLGGIENVIERLQATKAILKSNSDAERGQIAKDCQSIINDLQIILKYYQE